jgi:hypothetical protein
MHAFIAEQKLGTVLLGMAIIRSVASPYVVSLLRYFKLENIILDDIEFDTLQTLLGLPLTLMLAFSLERRFRSGRTLTPQDAKIAYSAALQILLAMDWLRVWESLRRIPYTRMENAVRVFIALVAIGVAWAVIQPSTPWMTFLVGGGM